MEVKKSNISYIQIFGERNSGTNYFTSLLRRNLINIEVGSKLGWKHGFIKDLSKYEGQSNTTLFICLFKNPYAWLISMHNKPHHAPQMLGLTFSEFLRERWVCYKGKKLFERDLEKNPLQRNEEMRKERNPVTGKRIANVVKLRSLKNKYFLALNKKAHYFETIKYEDLLINPHKEILQIAEKYNLKCKTKFKPLNQYYTNKPKQNTFDKKDYYLNEEYLKLFKKEDIEFVNSQLNFDLENQIGYNLLTI